MEGNIPLGDGRTTDLGMDGDGPRRLGGDDPADRGSDPGGDGDADGDADAADALDACPGRGGCDWFEQCGCAVDEACLPSLEGAPECELAGTADLYERCEETGCRPGLLCLGDSQDRYTCAELCDGTHGCGEGECLYPVWGAGDQEIASVCAVTGCDPLGGGGCPAGQSCSFILDGTVCVLPGPTRPGGPCVWNEDCVTGASCLYAADGDTSGLCFAHCDPNEFDPCPGGQQCWPMDDFTGVCDSA